MGNNGQQAAPRKAQARRPSSCIRWEALPGEAVHREIRRVEQENVGVESAHKGEETARGNAPHGAPEAPKAPGDSPS